jgi:hypothetical protein
MTSGVPLLLSAFSDIALSAMHKQLIRQAAAALNILGGKILTVGESPFSGDISLVEIHQPLFEFEVVVPACDINGTDTAVETAGSNKIRIYCPALHFGSVGYFA